MAGECFVHPLVAASTLSPWRLVVAFIAATVAGALNAAAGGGSFISFPALIAAGFPSMSANATNNTAMWVGTMASVGGFRRELAPYKHRLYAISAVGIAGGLAGSLLLLHTTQRAFDRFIPWLLLLATLLFALSPLATRYFRRHATHDPDYDGVSVRSPAAWAILFVTAVYGGYFGAGIGFVIIATLAALGATDVTRMSGVKNVMAACVNGIAVVPFAFAGIIAWPEAGLMSVGSLIGGYYGAELVRRLPQRIVRFGIIALGGVLTIYFFVKNG